MTFEICNWTEVVFTILSLDVIMFMQIRKTYDKIV